ncbi:hypothetical protein SAMN05660209_03542 [Geodermatophilus africanus]|uniref:Uncharacterized protein n=1 Tax=Geodermatophilus africanus TaxID=1137993 RepID=A0A1H3M578_9ACTN|nr:hypothetical protein [Geodermatophilus africanus]SDY71359.1 hypothetical protein SAMN05660209_03542 [Geodermatophilus africanus]
MTALAPAPAPREVLRSRRSTPTWQLAAALGLAAAGGLHVAAAVDHLSAGQLAVGFFLLTALAQAGLAAWLVLGAWAGTRPGRVPVAGALLGTVALLVLYVLAHTTGLLDAFAVHDAGTAGHEHDVPGRVTTAIDPLTGVEFAQGMPLGAAGPVAMDGLPTSAGGHGPEAVGTAVVAAELLSVAALAALLPASWRGRALNGLLALGGAAWLLWLTGVLG